MQKALFIILFSQISCFCLFAQDIQQLKEYADQQFNKGNYSIALKEYQRILLFDDAHRYDGMFAKIASLYYRTEDYNNAVVYFDFARKAVSQDSLKYEYGLKKILCYYKQDNFLLGLSELYDFPDQLSPYFENKKNLYFAICHFGLGEHAESLNYFAQIVDSTGLEQIDSLVVLLNKYQKKYNPDKLEMMSIFLPGLGQTYGGDIGSGLNSVLLLSGIAAYSYHTMVTYRILDGILVLTSWFYRYYTGGHRKAYKIGDQKILVRRNSIYRQILTVVAQHPKR